MREQLTGALDEFATEMRGLAMGQPLFPGIAKLTHAFETFRNAVQNKPESKGELIHCRDRLVVWFDMTISSIEAAALEWKPTLDKHQADYHDQKKALQGKAIDSGFN